jgi:membrane protein implicated in regulation of membrane protease activity
MGWLVWVIVAVVCGVGETLTNRFWLAPLALGVIERGTHVEVVQIKGTTALVME